MPVMDEFREEREAMKQKSFKERFSYFCEYYKWHVIGGMALAALAIIPGAITGVGAYFATLYSDLEYEYLYLDKELVIDKVMAKSRRKRVAAYQVDRMEIMAPFRSYRLDNYKNRQVKIKDYSIGEEQQPDLRYAVYYEGGEKLILSPSQEMVKAIRNVAPRKVFTD